MKTSSAIYTAIQRPFTMFGVPPLLFGIASVLPLMVFGGLVAVDLISLALIAALATFIGIWIFLFRRTRADCHFASRVFVTPRFWGSRRCRYMIAGQSKTSRANGRNG